MANDQCSKDKQSEIQQIEALNCFTELSEIEQESLAGGYDLSSGFDFLIFQDTAIDTFGESQTSISNNDGLNAVNTTRTGYSFRQTTLVLAFSRFGGGTCKNNPLAMLFGLFQQFGLGGGR